MAKEEIIILLITIFLSCGFFALFLNSLLKDKPSTKKEEKKPEQIKEEVEEKQVISEAPKEVVEEKNETIDVVQEEIPEISQGMKDELEEFRAYLKERITPQESDEFGGARHAYSPPKFNPLDDYDDFDDDFTRYRRGKRAKDNDINKEFEELSMEMKMLLMSDIFDTKF